MTFENRWQIRGTLTTRTPLQIGCGKLTQRGELAVEDEGGSPGTRRAEVSSVSLDYFGRPCIPGSALRGALRAFLEEHGRGDREHLDELVGRKDAERTQALGGKLHFWDARFDSSLELCTPPPYWDPGHLAGVKTGVALNRRTRTAQEHKLFYHEQVPPGVSFEVEITGEDLSHSQVEEVLFALASFNHGYSGLGASRSDGAGSLTWNVTSIGRLQRQDVNFWLKSAGGGLENREPPEWRSLPEEDRNFMQEAVDRRLEALRAGPSISFNLEFNFDGNFLVNDPSRAKSKTEGGDSGPEKAEERPDHAPLLDTRGRPLLPASSVRGALRAQAERIVRTIAQDPSAACQDVPSGVEAGDSVRTPCSLGQTAAAEKLNGKVSALCHVCRLFGAPGWRTLVQVSDFEANGPSACGQEFSQEFVAIDRFTGGAKKQAKFNAHSFYKPCLSGTLSVDLSRLQKVDGEKWALGLMFLLLRDLSEGDIPMGFGAAKGYGTLCCTVKNIEIAARERTTLADLENWEPRESWQEARSEGSPLAEKIRECIECLFEELKSEEPS